MVLCKRVAIVGGGLSGTAMIKALKEDGIEPICFEKTNNIGGTWYYREEAEYGVASITSKTIINHSKELGATSDFPPPDDYPNYMSHRLVYKNFLRFVKHFDLMRHVICNREVIYVKRNVDYEDTGRWTVTVKNTETGETVNNVFDGVMICTGHIAHPAIPQIPGIEKFTGKIIHSHSLKTFGSFEEKRVVVLGGGCSALDAAAEISNVTNPVHLSMRTPSWIMPRVGPDGVPFDYALLRRSVQFVQSILPLKWLSRIIERFFLDAKFNHKLYGINPKYSFLSRDPVINDALPAKLISGSIVLKKNIQTMEKHGVVFEGDDRVTKTDIVVMATGYKWHFPYLEEGILLNEPGGKFQLYKCMYPPHLKHPTLAFIGFVLPLGPGFPIGEIQIRWASYLMCGHSQLPSREIMMDEIENRYRMNVKRYSPSDKMSQRVEFVAYMDDIASQFGAMPNLWKLLISDPKLFMACVFGPCLPYQYRLEGPHRWEGAREAILTSHRRMKIPLCGANTPLVKKTQQSNWIFNFIMIIFVVAVLLSGKNNSVLYYFLILLLPYFFSIRGIMKRYLFVIMLLPFFIPIQNFLVSYITTLFLPLILSVV